jgi:hypothetical protein
MVFFPGVPVEMKKMVRGWLTPRLKQQFPVTGGRLKTIILKTAGLGESTVDSRIADLMGGKNPAVGLLSSPDLVRVLVTAEGADEAALEAALAPTLAELEKRLAGHIFGRGEETLAEAAAARLVTAGLRLSLCDAVTRGRLSGLLGPALPASAWAGAWAPPGAPQGAPQGLLETPPGHSKTTSGPLETPSGPSKTPSGPSKTPSGPSKTPSGALPPIGEGELRLTLTARPDPAAPPTGPGQTALVIDSLIEGPGRSDRRSFALGGPEARALARAAALAAFHLWSSFNQRFPES